MVSDFQPRISKWILNRILGISDSDPTFSEQIPNPMPKWTERGVVIVKNGTYFGLTPRFPIRQIGEFRHLRRDCARLRDPRMSWKVSKGRAAVRLSYIEAWTFVESHVPSEFEKVCAMIFFRFHDFSTFTVDCARLRGHRILQIVSKCWAVVP